MARPNLQKERHEQILIAFEACVARYGVEGATLEKVAEEAGLARALIRHNIGNRQDLLDALVVRFLEQSKDSMSVVIETLPAEDGLSVLVDALFNPAYSNTKLVLVSEALIAASMDDPALAKKMRHWVKNFVVDLENVITDFYPMAGNDRIEAVAAGLTGIYFNVESLRPLGNIKSLASSSLAAAKLLINTLECNR